MIKSFLSNRNFNKGKDCFAQKDYKNAAEYFQKAAEEGHVDAQFNLGILYAKGLGVPKNKEDALRWLGKAASQGHAGAKKELGLLKGGMEKIENEIQHVEDPEEQDDLGRAYLHGEGVEQNYEEAAKWFRKAAEQGHRAAQFNLGMRYYGGQGVEKNLTEAFKWISMAMEQGVEASQPQSILGQAYFFGEGTPQNFPEAVKWLTKASCVVISENDEDGMIDVESFKQDADAQFYLGWCYLTGNGVTKNIKKAETFFRAAASRNETHSLRVLKAINDEGFSINNLCLQIIRTHTQNEHHEQMAILEGTKFKSNVRLIVGSLESLPEKKYELGLKYLKGQGVKKNEKEGARFIFQAAEGGYAPASNVYADLLEEGKGVPQDLTESLTWRRKAAEQGDADAQFLIGYKHEHGEGLPQDNVKALNWYRKSAEQGYSEGQFHYGLMLYYGSGVGEKNEEEGLRWIRLAVEQGHEHAESVLEDLSKKSEAAPDDPLEELYRDGLNEKNAGNFDKAIAIWKKILEKDFRRLNAINAIACAYAESGKLDMAKKYIDMAMKVGGDQADFVRINLAGILYDTGKFEEAEEILNAIECKDGRMIDNLTRVLVAQGKSERALELIEEFLAKEGASITSRNDDDRSLQEIFTRGVDCILECKPSKAIEFLEIYAHILPSEPLSSVYFNAGIHFLQEENDGVRALRCLAAAVKNNPDDAVAREALSDAALKVIADFGGQGKISENDKAALATAYETVGNKQKALEIKRQIVSVEISEGKKPPLRLVTAEIKSSGKSSAEEGVVEEIPKETGDLESFWNEVALKAGERTGLHLITSIEKNKAMSQIIFRRGSVKGVYFVFSLRANDWVVRIDIDFGAGKDQANNEFFDKLGREASGIEKVFGHPLQWEKGKGRTCKIICPSGTGGMKTPEKWSSIQVAMVDMMARLEKAVGPIIEKAVERS